MIDHQALRIYVDFREKTGSLKDYTVKKRDDGMIEYHSTYDLSGEFHTILESIVIKLKNFKVNIYPNDHLVSDTKRDWGPYLNIFNEFFHQANENQLKILCGQSCFNFSFGIFHCEFHQSSQDDMLFIKKYSGWPYFQFNYKYTGLYTIKEFSDILENDFDIYEVFDRDWSETKIFVKEMTVDSIKNILNTLLALSAMNKTILEEMDKTQKSFYKKNSDLWIKTLKGFRF